MKTPAEKIYGKKRLLVADEDFSLVKKVEEELEKAGYEDIACSACDRENRVTKKEAEENRLAPSPQKWYCGCANV